MITRTHREHTAKVAIISSIARSQEALAGILANIAEISDHSDLTARKLAENIRLLTGYQAVMTEMLTGIPLNRTKIGSPSSPWLATGCSTSPSETAHMNSSIQEDQG